eukprot:CAMPEP_0206236744 /NCGR_PEP_ID=MMETSP0047_2-20121206/13881_1 /ASSEMBLY_ACC=CAM_ASM_000192 /TAXON_ID=195065 /ORGANISM="Chroomonas mesostigmatica_cf, Strain CCMP1168" /LENGTH=585 /DNA_ID=CAMNT_0053661105 /DNA_START=37 /DNA_END=1790 /DNA_ORIENTATION=-
MAAIHGTDTVPKSSVQLTIECKGLRNKDTLSKSDPTCIVQHKAKDGRWIEIGRTEKVMNDLNPKFKKQFTIDYFFEEVQDLQFLVYDVDTNSGRLEDQDFLGSLQTTLGSIVGSRGSCLTAALTGTKGQLEKRYGSIKVLAEEISSHAGDSIKLRLAGNKLETKDWMGKGDKYLVIKRQRGDGNFEEVHRTEVIKNSKDPAWAPIELPLAKLNLGRMDAHILFELMDWNNVTQHDFMGQVICTTNDLLTPRSFKIEKLKSKNPGKDRGELIVQFSELHHPPTFLEYVAGGCEITVMMAIDFTASNKTPSDPQSLHFMNPGGWNSYQQAIISIGEILEKYDHDKNFEAYGFGGKLPNGQVSHCFALNGDAANPSVRQVQGILDAYQQCLVNVQLYGPTNFASVIRAAHQAAKNVQPPRQAYYVLLIITDGEITDLDDTVDAIIAASGEPLSIVIVGVGPADFGKMHRLDGDDRALTSAMSGKKTQRDIVQFVAFRELKNNGPMLAKEVLAEIPQQLTSYMKSKNMKPMPRPAVSSQWDAQVQQQMANMNLNDAPTPAAQAPHHAPAAAAPAPAPVQQPPPPAAAPP